MELRKRNLISVLLFTLVAQICFRLLLEGLVPGSGIILPSLRVGLSFLISWGAFQKYFLNMPGLAVSPSSEGRVISYSSGSGSFSNMESGSGGSGWTDFDIDVLTEPFSETEMGGASVNSSIPRVASDEAGPSGQGSVVRNASLESSMRNRILQLERVPNQTFLLGKPRGTYVQDLLGELRKATSQAEYNRLLDFENRDLLIREQKQKSFSIFQEVLSDNADMAKQSPYNPEEVFKDFLTAGRDKLDLEHPTLPVRDRDHLELNWLDQVRQELEDGGTHYLLNVIFSKFGG
ncbi:hypothetical protein A565_p03 (mitochondrion) [Erythranthe guttata]|uniref:Uncharacterized protein n=1 Tax=Erythranthe guttata TaxID=4155 RepID=I1T1W5_ERYGU|nr:hypothetical protein OOB38_mgp23 [Erythranthe guttata]AEK26544.1 hypothetical protein [Erythranthe guttata]|eukprot:YP_006460166.1 hypothetical protein A565_p03 (mitochondrion) [Erythranthe guttata]